MSILFDTSLGTFTIDLHYRKCPSESKLILDLSSSNYYQYAPFINLNTNVYVEIGDPLFPISTNGAVKDAVTVHKNELKHERIGTVSMVPQRTASGLVASSRLLITFDDSLDFLDKQDYIVIGQVKDGFKTLNSINEALVDYDKRPLVDIRIKKTFVLNHPFFTVPHVPLVDDSKKFPRELIPHVRLIDSQEQVLENDELLLERNKKQEAKNSALTLEMIGDLPYADVKPLETVLFVCKLNPVTQSEDLKMIFSRFGDIKSCEVVKDKETGKSLTYAFIEFEDKESCERAYLKMDDVLIDDRRIHVDFSQSVWNFKKRKLNGH